MERLHDHVRYVQNKNNHVHTGNRGDSHICGRHVSHKSDSLLKRFLAAFVLEVLKVYSCNLELKLKLKDQMNSHHDKQ